MWDQENQICKGRIGKLTSPSSGAGVLTNEIFGSLAKGAYTLGKHGLSQAVRSSWAKRKARELSGKCIDQALDGFGKISGGKFDIQRQLAKLGEPYMRIPTRKKYNYCGHGTKLTERL